MTGPGRPPTRRTYALLAAGWAAFVVYGSLVPFEFRGRPAGDAGGAFGWAMVHRAVPQSRADGLANLLLGMPLGFFVLAAARVDRPGRGAAAAAGVLLLPACVLFAAAVEFSQLYLPARTCAGSDVIAQGLGAAGGMAAWVAVGPGLTAAARGAWAGGGGLLAGYLLALAFVQTLPMDLSASPADVYRKVRDGRVVAVPFSEFRRDPDPWDRLRKLVELTALYLPAGLLAGRRPGPWPGADPLRAAGLAVSLAAGMESIQLVVLSRTPSATDVVVGAAAAFAGWLLARTAPRAALPWLAGGWLLAVLVAGWQPFDVSGTAAAFDWLPGLPLERKNPLFALEEVLTKLAVFAPFGVLAGWAGGRPWLGAAAGAGVAAAVEAGQVFLPSHTACVTDIVLGCGGGWLGARVGLVSEEV